MQISLNVRMSPLRHSTRQLLQKMHSPICGINTEMGFVKRSRHEPKIITCGAEVCGVHVLQGRENPGKGAYHIGGAGVSLDEAVVKSLGELVERYAQLAASRGLNYPTQWCSYADLKNLGEAVISDQNLSFFTDTQFKKSGFPFTVYSREKNISWVKVPSLMSGNSVWVPAQLFLVGYLVKSEEGEPWLAAAVTTGTATHVTYDKAIRNALLELVQIDSVMGHWHSNSSAYQILLDERVDSVSKILKKYGSVHLETPRFFFLPNPDLAGFTVACLITKKTGSYPKLAIGLGADTRLPSAMYKAYLEACGTFHLAKIELLKDRFFDLDKHKGEKDHFYDLDRNVAHYAIGGGDARIQSRFFDSSAIKASDLPPDLEGTPADNVRTIVQSFKATGKELVFADLTPVEAKDLGLCVARVWSPDTLSLCLPSAPVTLHSRFQAYGGFSHDDPHPYP